ncbi:MAG: RNA polymerase sigma factor [Candidatus Sumerlaeia bacterium]|nr:RNA polymerase sigma factor [Candidatus Sumerlaeia bacterium]
MASMETFEEQVSRIYRENFGKAFATLIRLLGGDFDLAEEALQEAFAKGISAWRTQGVPENPTAWLVSTARFKGIDMIRRRARLTDLKSDLLRREDEIEEWNHFLAAEEIPDDRLRLIFTCCHPAIDPKVQVPLTLREVCGLTNEEIASAFLAKPTTMAQRIVRGKAKIRDAGIPYVVPDLEDLPERLDAVLSVIYLVFNEGYCASAGDMLTRVDLSEEAIRLGRVLVELLPDPEAQGLLALMLLHESRRAARVSPEGDIILLEDQDRSLWNRALIEEGAALVGRSLASRQLGSFNLQAAIAAVHSEAPSSEDTDWNQIVALYTILLRASPSPVVELNRAVAIAMRDGPEAGLALIDEILSRGDLQEYHLAHAARGELLRRAGKLHPAREAIERALSLAKQEPERRLLLQRFESLSEQEG